MIRVAEVGTSLLTSELLVSTHHKGGTCLLTSELLVFTHHKVGTFLLTSELLVSNTSQSGHVPPYL